MNVKEKIGLRIRKERTSKGLTRKALSALTESLSVSRINNYERGDRTPGPEEIKLLASVLEVSPAFLMCLSDDRQGKLNKKTGIGALLPILDYGQACDPASYIEQIKNEESSEQFNLTPISPELANRVNKNAFALAIKDDSMSPEFRTGDTVIVDPMTTPIPGDYVVYHLEGEKEVVVRKYKQISTDSSNHFILVALNDDWANTEVGKELKGQVVGTAMSLSRDLK